MTHTKPSMEQLERNMYLIQRCTDQVKLISADSKGVDKILDFDYMGSSEFEWGTVPHTFKVLRDMATSGKLVLAKTPTFRTYKNEPLWTILPDTWDMGLFEIVLQKISENKVYHKEYDGLSAWVKSPNTGMFSEDSRNHNEWLRTNVTSWVVCIDKRESDPLMLPAFWSIKEGTARKLYLELCNKPPELKS